MRRRILVPAATVVTAASILGLLKVADVMRWETLDSETLAQLSAEQGHVIDYAAAYWKNGKIMKLRIKGPAIDEVRYFDGRIEKQ